MWVRKTEKQVAGERQRLWLSFREPALLSLVVFSVSVLLAIEGPRYPPPYNGRWPNMWREIFGGSAFMALVAGVAGYVFQLVVGKTIASMGSYGKIDICNACYRVKRRDRDNKCECGGEFENFDNWMWIDDGGEAEE
jgi:hypothetical protein